MPLTPATPPDMRVRIGRFSGLRKAIGQRKKTERVKVGVGQRVFQSGTIREMPRTIRAARSLCGELCPDAQTNELPIPNSAALPLSPDHGSQSMPDPFVQFAKRLGCLAESKVALPAPEVGGQLLYHLLQTDPTSPSSQFPDLLLTAQSGLRRDSPLGFLIAAEAESQELPLIRSCYRTLRFIDLELETSREKARDRNHHALPGSFAADIDVTVVRVPHETMLAPF